VSLSVRAIEHPSFIRGRVGSIFIDNKEAGLIGEIHPAVLENFGLEQPAVGFELNLSRFIG
jgi:phenylalanyl-tRNA synthetase beta chain